MRQRATRGERERSLWTINKSLKVGKYKALSGNTASGRDCLACRPCLYYNMCTACHVFMPMSAAFHFVVVVACSLPLLPLSLCLKIRTSECM